MTKIPVVLSRKKVCYGEKCWFITNSVTYGVKWHNTLYLMFYKNDFPNIGYPKIEQKYGLFDYYDTELSKLNFHGGITFYEEMLHIESGKTIVKVGCDYNHLGDDIYTEGDNGEYILLYHTEEILNNFKKLNEEKNK